MVQGHALIETIMEHAAAQLGLDPLSLKMNNMLARGDQILPPPLVFGKIRFNEIDFFMTFLDDENPLEMMIEQVVQSSDYSSRKEIIDQFNTENRWKKRGISVVPMRYFHNLTSWSGLKYNCQISIFGADGSVSVSHNGVEMGQGINTKVAQCVAHELGVDVDMVKIKAVTGVTNPNGSTTGGSVGSEGNCFGAIKACGILKERLAPIRDQLGPDATWSEIIDAANQADVDLCARYLFDAKKDNYNGYNVWGVTVSEVEVDILTGEHHVLRVDILNDAGLAVNPNVDIGQVEGAFIMGLGLWTSEEIKFDPATGELLTRNTWEYKPPAAKDIPQDFRVTLLKNARNPHGVMSSKGNHRIFLYFVLIMKFSYWRAPATNGNQCFVCNQECCQLFQNRCSTN